MSKNVGTQSVQLRDVSDQGTKPQLPPAASASLFGMMVLLAQPSTTLLQPPAGVAWHVEQTLGTLSFAEQAPGAITDNDILGAIGQLHDRMLRESQELSAEARDVLYSNLWQLYE